MSETPPPVNEAALNDDKVFGAESTIELDLSGSTENIALNDDEPTVAAPKATASTAASSQPQTLSDDMFFSTVSEPMDAQKKPNEDMDEIFKSNAPPASKETPPIVIAAVTPAAAVDPFDLDKDDEVKQKPAGASNTALDSLSTSYSAAVSPSTTFTAEELDEVNDKFIQIALSDPHKIGDGMGSYMVYKITTKTNHPAFRLSEFSAQRRFSDFLNLFEKLKEKHLPRGRILPPAPEKDMLGMAKVKMSKEDTTPIDFIERRRVALERFLNRLAQHKTFRQDPDFRDFLETAEDLPKANNTSALSGAGMLKMFKNVTDSVNKISVKMEETDQWFEEKTRLVENLFVQFKKLHSMVDMLYGWRRDLAVATKDFSKNVAILANAEEQLNLSRTLSQLGEIYEKIDQIYVDQASSDCFVFAELAKDYVALLDNIKEVFYQRIKTYSMWQKNEEMLKVKKEQRAKLEATNKLDKVPAVAAEINDLEGKVEKSKEDFEQISKNIKEEMHTFDIKRVKEFKTEMTKYLETLLHNQETLAKHWEQYLPQVKAI